MMQNHGQGKTELRLTGDDIVDHRLVNAEDERDPWNIVIVRLSILKNAFPGRFRIDLPQLPVATFAYWLTDTAPRIHVFLSPRY